MIAVIAVIVGAATFGLFAEVLPIQTPAKRIFQAFVLIVAGAALVHLLT